MKVAKMKALLQERGIKVASKHKKDDLLQILKQYIGSFHFFHSIILLFWRNIKPMQNQKKIQGREKERMNLMPQKGFFLPRKAILLRIKSVHRLWYSFIITTTVLLLML